MAETPPAKAPTGPKVSGTRTIVSLVFLAIVLVVCIIEVRAGLGQFLTMRSFEKVSEDNLFKNVTFDDAQGMVAAFASESEVKVGVSEDVHHYYWYSLLRPLLGKEAVELYVSADHNNPAMAISFYTSTEGEITPEPRDPNAPPMTAPMTGMPGMGGGPPGGGMPGMGGGRPGGPPSGGGGGGGMRPPLDEVPTAPAATEPAATEPAATEPAASADAAPAPTSTDEPAPATTEATPEPANDGEKTKEPTDPE